MPAGTSLWDQEPSNLAKSAHPLAKLKSSHKCFGDNVL